MRRGLVPKARPAQKERNSKRHATRFTGEGKKVGWPVGMRAAIGKDERAKEKVSFVIAIGQAGGEYYQRVSRSVC
jgi:hypothetical protein